MAKGGKGGGGKGKKGGGCSPGDIVIVSGLPSAVFQAVKDAFNKGVPDPGGATFTVRLECSVAELLVFAVATDMGTNFVRKKPKGKKGGGK
jgi:hypothetical protein